jgi:nitrite reductase/ring-hydroxylating ferredoxin subunit
VIQAAAANEFIALCPVREVALGTVRKISLADGLVVAVFNVENTLYVTEDTCTHGAASLSDEGELHGHVVECGWHFGAFDVRTGAAVASPCKTPLKTYPVEIRDGIVCISRSDSR